MFSRYADLADFFLIYGDGLVESPWLGKIDTINFIYSSVCKKRNLEWKETSEKFQEVLKKFNDLSNGALEFRKTYVKPGIELVYVNNLKVEMLKKHIAGDGVKHVYVKPVNGTSNSMEDVVKKILEPPASSIPNGLALLLIDCNGEEIKRLLEKPTAAEVLATERARLLTPRKAFYLACDDDSHNQALAKLCFNPKTFGQSVLDLPSNAKIRKIINNNKTQLSKAVFNCSKLKVHYLPLLTNSTDVTLGNCSYLDTCHKLKSCRYLHFYTLNPQQQEEDVLPSKNAELLMEYTIGEPGVILPETPPQWINCDVRQLPFSVLGKFAAIISDPAWDIHMSLPYGTCKDAELLSLPMHELQDEGILFLWVTGRSIEIGRKALAQWGYTVTDEMIWVKLNQLRRTIVTGRTGHWLNHSKENLIVGVKGNPIWLNRKIDLDYIVSGTRETSRKPDELYDIVDRLVGKHARKLEIFGRDHNIRKGWFSTCFEIYSYKNILTYSNWEPVNRNLNP